MIIDPTSDFTFRWDLTNFRQNLPHFRNKKFPQNFNHHVKPPAPAPPSSSSLLKNERDSLRRCLSLSIPPNCESFLIELGPGAAPAAIANTIATLTPILSPYYSITTITNPNTFITDPWQPSTALLIFPGGRDVPYCHSLNGSPNAAITSWIRHRGGKFLGFCAGGYYGSKRCEFEVGDPVLEVVGTRELGFFGGTCRGAAFEGFVYDKEAGARAAGMKVLGLDGCEEEIKCYCNGGGVFVDADEMEGKGVEV